MSRISAIIIIASVFSCHLCAQETLPHKDITLNFENVPLNEVIQELSENYSVHFFFSPSKIPVDKPVSLNVESVTIEELLDDLCSQLEINYRIKGNEIILYPSTKDQIKEYTISGFVSDSLNGERLIGANIFITDLTKGLVTNGYGYFSYTLPQGKYVIRCTYVGYSLFDKVIDLNNDMNLTITLVPEIISLKEVELKRSSIEKISSAKLGHDDVPMMLLRKYPSMLGENDIVQFLKMLPGIQSNTDGFNGLYVRGGTPQQTSFILDDAPLFNIYHISGWFSSINPDALKEVEIYKSHLPGKACGTLSSVVDIRMRDGNNQKYSVKGGIGTLTSRLTVEGPVIKNKSSFIISVRRSYLDQLSRLISKNNEENGLDEIYFYDMNGKVNYMLNRNNRFYLSSYLSKDVLQENNGISWRNYLLSYRWNHLFNDHLFSNLSISESRYFHQFTGFDIENEHYTLSTGIRNYSLKYDFTHYSRKNQKINFGFSGYYQELLPMHNVDPHSRFFLFLNETGSSKRIIYNAYAEGNFSLSTKMNAGGGVKLSVMQNVTPKNSGFLLNSEPSVNLQYEIFKNASIKGSYSRNYQYHHSVSVYDLLIPFEQFLFADKTLKPQYADHFSTGFIMKLKKPEVEITLEPFLSLMKNQYRFLVRNETFLGYDYQKYAIKGKANVYGIEFSVRKTLGRTTGMLSYTWSMIDKQEAAVNRGVTYNPAYDRRHDLAFSLACEISKRFTVSASWVYMTGNPYSQPYAKYEIRNRTVLLYNTESIYNRRMPDYHRLDLGGQFKLGKSKKFTHSLAFSIYNIYGRKNSLFYFYSDAADNGSTESVNTITEKYFHMFSFYGFQFFPAFSYEFKFN